MKAAQIFLDFIVTPHPTEHPIALDSAFEKFFLTKMRLGLRIPWFEGLGERLLGLNLVYGETEQGWMKTDTWNTQMGLPVAIFVSIEG